MKSFLQFKYTSDLLDLFRKSELSLGQLAPNGAVATFFKRPVSSKLCFETGLLKFIGFALCSPACTASFNFMVFGFKEIQIDVILILRILLSLSLFVLGIIFIRYLAKRSFAVDVAQKKVATTPLGGSCVNDNSDFRKKSIYRGRQIMEDIDSVTNKT